MYRTKFVFTTCLLSILLLTSISTAQEASERQIFSDDLDVRVVNLEVVVTHKRERVPNLTSDDFILRVDGKEMPIEFFTEIRDGYAQASAPSTDGSKQAPAVKSADEPGTVIGNRYLLFIDNVFTIKSRRNQLLNRLRRDLPQLGPDDSMAIVAFNGRQIQMVTSWTSSLPELERSLTRAMAADSYGLQQLTRWNPDLWYEEEIYARASRPLDRRLDISRTRGSRAYTDLEGVLDAATSTLRAFARPPGRKVMMVLAGNWPARVDWQPGSIGALGYTAQRPDSALFAPLVDTANLLGYTLYPVDVPGVQTNVADASYRTVGEAEVARWIGRGQERSQEAQLVSLARETGGKAQLNGSGVDLLRRIQEDTRSYYSIGFTPDWQANDIRHRVKVELKGPGRARLRRSFSDLSPETETTFRVQSAQLFDMPIPGSAPLNVSVGSVQDGGFRKVLVPLEVEIPVGQLTHLPSAGGWATHLQLRVAVTDDRGRRSDIPLVPIVLETADQPTANQTAMYGTTLKMRERPHRVLVSLVDPATGTEHSGRLKVDFSDL